MESILQKPALVPAEIAPTALIAHLSVGDGPEAWGWAAATRVPWGLSYVFWRRQQASPSERS
jgi:hypothetical protein